MKNNISFDKLKYNLAPGEECLNQTSHFLYRLERVQMPPFTGIKNKSKKPFEMIWEEDVIDLINKLESEKELLLTQTNNLKQRIRQLASWRDNFFENYDQRNLGLTETLDNLNSIINAVEKYIQDIDNGKDKI